MNRRTWLATAALGTLSTIASTSSRAQQNPQTAIDKGLKEFGALSPSTAAHISIQSKGGKKSYALNADQPLFVGSAVKTFILAQYLQEVEAGRLSEDTQVKIGPDVWSPGSPVLINLEGSTSAKIVLEAMIAHSDNTATDITLNAVGANNVRQQVSFLQSQKP